MREEENNYNSYNEVTDHLFEQVKRQHKSKHNFKLENCERINKHDENDNFE